jgi:hypothetical protein
VRSLAVAAVTLIACVGCNQHDSGQLFEHQTMCGNAARDWYAKEVAGSEGGFGLNSHYNQKLNRCFLVWTYGNAGTNTDQAWSTALVDVNENRQIGDVLQHLNSDKAARCEIEGQTCLNETEWKRLLQRYMEQ